MIQSIELVNAALVAGFQVLKFITVNDNYKIIFDNDSRFIRVDYNVDGETGSTLIPLYNVIAIKLAK